MAEQWSPLGAEDDESGALDGPHEGVPSWLRQSLWDWIDPFFEVEHFRGGRRFTAFDDTLARSVERACRVPIPYAGIDRSSGVSALRQAFNDEGLRLRLVDYLLNFRATAAQRASLDRILREAGSVWSVGTRLGSPGLQRRVGEALTTAAAEAVIAGHAGQRLAAAWNAAFGLNPNASTAYSLAIKAIEDVAKPVISPNDASATLGRINGQISGDDRWTLPFQRDDSKFTSRDALVAVLRTIWAGQVDRHGGDVEPGAAEPIAVSPEAAEAAVVLAVSIVHLFSSGAVHKEP